MADRDPHDILGVPRDADAATIKSAWRRLAREHHPDVSGGDPRADDPRSTKAATRRMAEINAAYEALRDDRSAGRPGAARAARPNASRAPTSAGPTTKRPSGPPRPRPTRPVTRRVDTSDTFQARNRTAHARAAATRAGARVGPASPGRPGVDREPLRASDPSGPLHRSRSRRFVPPAAPTLEASCQTEMPFGKFHGHTLGEIAAFEPSYIDWIATTVRRDPAVVAAARVIQADLDRRSVVRRRTETDRQRQDRERHAREWAWIFAPDE